MGGLPGAPKGCPSGGVELEDVARFSGLIPSGPGGTLGALGDNGPSPGKCCWGII
jgi:hypothetical protein